MMDPNSEKRFKLLKKRLDALNFCEPLTIDSAALVERLLTTLLKTTEGFQTLKKRNIELEKNHSNQNLQLDPLKYQNKKLSKENNDLHYKMIKVKEDADFKDVK